MTILPEPAHFKKQAYARLLQEYPHVKTVLAMSLKKISTVLFTITVLNIQLTFNNVYAEPIVKLVSNPEQQTIVIGLEPQKITLSARVNDLRFHFLWKLEGPGKLEGDKTGPAVLYLPPSRIDESSGQVIITVTVTDEQKREAADKIIFTLVQPEPTPISTPSPIFTLTPTPIFTASPKPITRQVSIKKIIVKNERDAIVPFLNGTYVIKSQEQVSIALYIDSLPGCAFRVECTAIKGETEPYMAPKYSEEKDRVIIMYTVPNNSEEDMVTLRILNNDTGELIAQKSIRIKIIE